jgi:hypothetical protein
MRSKKNVDSSEKKARKKRMGRRVNRIFTKYCCEYSLKLFKIRFSALKSPRKCGILTTIGF